MSDAYYIARNRHGMIVGTGKLGANDIETIISMVKKFTGYKIDVDGPPEWRIQAANKEVLARLRAKCLRK